MSNPRQESDRNWPSGLLEHGRELIGIEDFVVLTNQDGKRLFGSANICPIVIMRPKVCCQGIGIGGR